MSKDITFNALQEAMLENQLFFQKIAMGCGVMAQLPSIEYRYNPRELVYQHDKVKLYHYQSRTAKPDATPLLVVFATVNRPEILDLFPEQSFIGHLLSNDMDVYLLDWGYPDLSDKDITLGQYVNEYLHGCVNFIREKSQLDKINLLGICQGGVICLSYAILHSQLKNLVLISTPIDFSTSDNKVGHFLRQVDVDLLVDVMGNVSGNWLTQFFISLRPFELIGKKYLKFVDSIENEVQRQKFLQVEKWLYDAPDQTGASFRELIRECYQDNKLIQGKLVLDGRRVLLENLNIPVLNVIAEDDEIVPPSASRDLGQHIGCEDYTEAMFPSGHIGIYISDKVGGNMAATIADWLKKHGDQST